MADSSGWPGSAAAYLNEGGQSFSGLTIDNESLQRRSRIALSVERVVSGSIVVGQVERIQAIGVGPEGQLLGVISASITATSKDRSFLGFGGILEDKAIGAIECNDLISGTIQATGETNSPLLPSGVTSDATIALIRVSNSTSARGIRSSISATQGRITRISTSGPIGTATEQSSFLARDGIDLILAATVSGDASTIIAQPFNCDVNARANSGAGDISAILTRGPMNRYRECPEAGSYVRGRRLCRLRECSED